MISKHRDRRKSRYSADAAHMLRRTYRAVERLWKPVRRALLRFLRHRLVRRIALSCAIIVTLVSVMALGLLWRLASGPIEFDIVTPWLKAAIEQNFGGKHTVTVGGTQIERDENGRTSLRLRDIVVRDRDGIVVASAPKAEVGISGRALLSGQVRAQSLNLVGAQMAVRIEMDGRVTIFAGADKRPIAIATPPVPPSPAGKAAGTKTSSPPPLMGEGFQDVAGALAWLDSVGATGLDGHDLHELGLKDGGLVVDDKRNGKHWTFDHINASLTRPEQGGITFKLESDNPNRPWVLSAAMRPPVDGVRAVGLEARKLSIRDIMLALRLDGGGLEADLPISASVRADIAADGTPQFVQGQLLVDAGTIVDHGDENVRIKVDRADFRFNWDIRRHNMIVPFQILAGGNQFTMRATLDAPHGDNGDWFVTMTRGDSVIDPVILAPADASDTESFALNRANLRARIDTVRRRIELEQGDFRRIDTRASHNVGIAVTGNMDFSGVEPHLAFGIAGTRMPLSVLKQLWPVFAATDVRTWVGEHISSGTVERVVIAGNSPMANFREDGPPMSEEGLSVDIESSATTLQPIADLPAIHDADLTVHITGSNARIDLGRGTVEVGSGRKLSVAGGVFEIADTHLKPAPAHTTFRIDGTLPAVATLLDSDALHDNAGIALDPLSTRGTVAAQVAVDFPIGKNVPKNAATYTINADLTNFAADKLLLNQRVEAPLLKVAASSSGYRIKGDVKINGMPAAIELVKEKRNTDAQLHLAANIDEAARRRLGMDLGDSVTGTIPVRVTGLFGSKNGDDRLAVDADLTPVSIDNLLPGWMKATGRPAHATYTLMKTQKSTRLDDLTIEGSGVNVKGSVEIDNTGAVVSANFPVFNLSDGDKASLKADRGTDGALRVVMQADVYDGRNFVKSSLAGAPDKNKKKNKQPDLDLDVKIGTVAGYNGETLRGLDLKLARRSGHVRSFAMTSKIGRDTPLTGDLRVRARDNHQVVYFETNDAGALFRFTDMYPRMFGGQMWVAMDPPTQERTPQIGTLYIRDFTVRGEAALERVVAGAPGYEGRNSVEFSEMHADFTRFPGKMAIRDGVVRGPLVGATVEGQIDYVRNDVHLRGTFVPFYGINNMFGQIPIVGLFLGGGSNEGLLGITYEAVGPPGAPRITVNPVSAIAPGLLRKFIPSPGTFDPNFIPPSR